MLREQLVGAGIFTNSELSNKTNYTLLAALAGMGKLVENAQ